MTYVVTENCIKCRYTDCVEVCPVDCFYLGENMVVINPEQCIDCGVCEPECPAEAIKSETAEGMEKWVELNQLYAQSWPRVSRAQPTPEDADKWLDVPNKLEEHFSPEPGIVQK
jgi:ferredoxin